MIGDVLSEILASLAEGLVPSRKRRNPPPPPEPRRKTGREVRRAKREAGQGAVG